VVAIGSNEPISDFRVSSRQIVQIKSSSSGECVDKLLNLVNKTKELKPNSKIIVSLATNHCDDRKLNRKVNTVNSLLHEFIEDTSVDIKELVVCVSTKPTMSNFLIQFKNETSLSLSNSFETKPLTFHTPIERLSLFVVFVRLVGAMVF
jgi:hypothetical protein